LQILSHIIIFVFMRLTLLTVGKTDIAWVREGLEMYASRLKHYVNFEIKEIPELKKVASLTKDQIKSREGELILKEIKTSDQLVLLDERGTEFRSLEFSDYLRQKMASTSRDIVFVIGGAYGFSEDVYSRCDSKISLSKMTYSHQLVRTIFAEQLYRAFTIMKGEPYHHE